MYFYGDVCWWYVYLASVACGSVTTEMSRIIFHCFESDWMSTGGHMYVHILAVWSINCHSLEGRQVRIHTCICGVMFST